MNHSLEKNEEFSIRLGNSVFNSRMEASEELVSIASVLKLQSGERKEIGDLKGFKWSLSKPMFETKLELENKCRYVTTFKGIGNITKIENAYKDIPNKLEQTQNNLKELDKDIQNATIEIQSPFQYEEKLSSLINKQNEINYKIELDDLKHSAKQAKTR